MLGGLPKAPTEDSPFTAFKRARDRQHYVLGQMLENKFISDARVSRGAARADRDHLQGHAAQPRGGALLRRARAQDRAGQVRRARPLRPRPAHPHHAVMAQQRAAEARGAARARGRRSPLRLPRAGRRTSTTSERDEFLERRCRAATSRGRAQRSRRRRRARIVAGKPYLGARTSAQGKKSYARLGALRGGAWTRATPRKIERWTREARQQADRRRSASRCASSRVESKKGSGKKAYVETVRGGAAGAAARRPGRAGRASIPRPAT